MSDTDDVLARECPACGDVYAAHSLESLAECAETMKGDE